MQPETTYRGILGDLERLNTALIANAAEAPAVGGGSRPVGAAPESGTGGGAGTGRLGRPEAGCEPAAREAARERAAGGDRGAQAAEGALRSQRREARRVRRAAVPRPDPQKGGAGDADAGSRTAEAHLVWLDHL